MMGRARSLPGSTDRSTQVGSNTWMGDLEPKNSEEETASP